MEDFGSISGTFLNQARVSRAGPLKSADEIVIGPCKLKVIRACAELGDHRLTVSTPSEATHSHDEQTTPKTRLDDRLSEIDLSDEERPGRERMPDLKTIPGLKTLPGLKTMPGLQPSSHSPAVSLPQSHYVIDDHKDLFNKLRHSLFHTLDIRKQDITGMSGNDLRQFANLLLEDIVQLDFKHVDDQLIHHLTSALLDEAFGFGVIQPLLSDPDVGEIMINQYDKVFVERNGSIQPHPLRFSSEAALRTVIDRMLQSAGKRIDEGSPMTDARLSCGSRLNAVIPPISLHGACLTLRKFPESRISLDMMVESKSMTEDVCAFLKNAVLNRKSVLISGGTGTGKTTLLNALISSIPPTERLITIEDAAELSLSSQVNHISLETRSKNIEGHGEVTIRELVRNALRMRPDRIIIGECRGPEALDMLSAMNTGHEGSMTTLHANSPRDAISRLETLVLMAQHGLPVSAIREQIASAIDLIIQLKRLKTGKRVISAVMSISGMESGIVQLQDVFELQDRASSIVPTHQY